MHTIVATTKKDVFCLDFYLITHLVAMTIYFSFILQMWRSWLMKKNGTRVAQTLTQQHVLAIRPALQRSLEQIKEWEKKAGTGAGNRQEFDSCN